MDINDLRSWHTVVMFAVFIGIVIWAWSGKNKRRFNEAANLPLNEPEHPANDKNKGGHHE
ncbi:MAG: cbb3-type cytochrome c oxidase subunit 3 [Thioalkalispiraceae bacterium]|jgi:cytochrome c oxidase cbb3-type subunit 4